MVTRVLAAAIALGVFAAAPPARATAAAPRLIDQNGHAFTLASLRGQPVVITFVSATCTQACPLINAQFAQTQALFDRDRVPAQLVTITLEPQHDTYPVMRKLALRFGARRARWIVATGSVRDVNTLLRAFGVHTGDEHTTFVYLFDRTGTFRDRLLASSLLKTQLETEVRAFEARH